MRQKRPAADPTAGKAILASGVERVGHDETQRHLGHPLHVKKPPAVTVPHATWLRLQRMREWACPCATALAR